MNCYLQYFYVILTLVYHLLSAPDCATLARSTLVVVGGWRHLVLVPGIPFYDLFSEHLD